MPNAMQESIKQQDFYGNCNMQNMAKQLIEASWKELENDAHLGLQECMHYPIAFHNGMMGEIMHMHQAIVQTGTPQLINAVIKEIKAHVEKEHWVLNKNSEELDNTSVILAVWSMHRKCFLTTNTITKFKARLNTHGDKQLNGTWYDLLQSLCHSHHVVCHTPAYYFLYTFWTCTMPT